MVWRWDQADPFGMAAANENPQALGAFNSNQRFPGQLYDKETNLHYNWHRDYDPQLGRYVQSDPIGLQGGVNTFVYVGGNAISAFDRRGLDTYKINRDLRVVGDSATSINNPISHTFLVTTNPNGSIAHTYSWGNDANLKGWNLDQPLDIKTAKEALAKNLAEKIGDASFDPLIKKAFDELNKKENEHANGIIYGNCKTEANKLIKTAKGLR